MYCSVPVTSKVICQVSAHYLSESYHHWSVNSTITIWEMNMIFRFTSMLLIVMCYLEKSTVSGLAVDSSRSLVPSGAEENECLNEDLTTEAINTHPRALRGKTRSKNTKTKTNKKTGKGKSYLTSSGTPSSGGGEMIPPPTPKPPPFPSSQLLS